MLNTINSDLIRGHINTIILKALFEGDRYGYDIIKEIEQKSSGQYQLKQPTLYSCLKRLEVQGFIRSYWGAKSSGGRRKYFTLTDMGRELFIKNQTEWEYSRTVIDKLISDREYDLSKVQTEYDENSESEPANIKAESAETEAVSEQEEFSEESAVDESEFIEEESASETENADGGENREDYQEEYIDTSSILSRLFENQNSEDSYTDKLATEEYTAKERVSSEGYFKDYSEEAIEETEENVYYDETSEEDSQEQITEENSDSLYYFPESEYVRQDPPPTHEEVAPQDAATANNFISYRERISEYDDDKRLLEREYRNVLGKLINGDTEESEPEQIPQPAYIPLSDEMAENIARIEADNTETVEEETAVTSVRTYSSNNLDQGLNDISDAALRGTGDNVKTRIHDGKAAANYNTQYHYYSNKLMLVHYAILFGIMILEVVFTFLLAKVGLKINSKYDVYTYIISTLIALAFPVTAAILNFTDPQKTKRFDYDFRNSMIFRIWITICCLVIIYCLNIFLGMPLSFSKDYLSSLLLPILLVLNFPVSAIIFRLLHDTGKFNQTY